MESKSIQKVNNGNKKLILHTIGYFLFGTFWIFFNGIPAVPFGLLAGLARIYQRRKNEAELRWRILLIALIFGVLLGAGIIPGVHISIFNISIGG